MEIVLYPDPRLTYPNERLGAWSVDAENKVKGMRNLLAQVGGVGLAAPQVGWNVRLFILAIDGVERIVYDPEVALVGGKIAVPEGCLSFPGMDAKIERHESVKLLGKTPEWVLEHVFTGFEAQAVQHEMDHLDGILYIERMTQADRLRNSLVLRGLEERWKRRVR